MTAWVKHRFSDARRARDTVLGVAFVTGSLGFVLAFGVLLMR